MKKNRNDRGITLYITIMILAIILATAVYLSSLMIGEFKLTGNVKNSMSAINVAGSALEAALYESRVKESLNTGSYDCSLFLGVASLNCSVNVDTAYSATSTCNGTYNCTKIQATGTSGQFNRKLQATYINR